jgi:hypothetical protein
VRHDDANTTLKLTEASVATTRRRFRVSGWGAIVAVLLVATSLAVATVSLWLVVPYLLLMAWILGPDPSAHETVERPPATEPSPAPRELSAQNIDDTNTVEILSADAVANSFANDDVPGDAIDSEPAKTRRGKGRGRKAKSVTPIEPSSPTWIRVGPGKFIRADASTPLPFEPPADGGGDPTPDRPTAPVETATEPEPEAPEAELLGSHASDLENWPVAPDTSAGDDGPILDVPTGDETPSGCDEALPQDAPLAEGAPSFDCASDSEPPADETCGESNDWEEFETLDEDDATCADDLGATTTDENDSATIDTVESEDESLAGDAGDQGIALDAFATDRLDDSEGFGGHRAESQQPLALVPQSVPRSTRVTSVVSWRGNRTQTRPVERAIRGANRPDRPNRAPCRIAKASVVVRPVRRRAGRARLIGRTFPPRSPPGTRITWPRNARRLSAMKPVRPSRYVTDAPALPAQENQSRDENVVETMVSQH